MNEMYFVYLLKCKDDSIYTGITTDVKRRLMQHKAGHGGHYTRAKGAVKIVYSEEHRDRSSALKREAQIKHWTRQMKQALIRATRA